MSMVDKLIGVVAPHICIGCGNEGRLICVWCAPDLFTPVPSKCYRCNAKTEDFSVCNKCRPSTRLKHVWIRTYYDGNAKRLIHKFKFMYARAAAKDIAAQIAQSIPYFSSTVLVPIPTATKRVRQRGFDHTKLLTRELCRTLKLENRVLLRRLGQSQQVGTRRTQRIKQVSGSFLAINRVDGIKIVLVDDVLTTGATLEEAARILKRAGAKQVDAVVFAQKI